MKRNELVIGETYAHLVRAAMWEIVGVLRRHERVRYIGTSCVGMEDKPGYVIVAFSFTKESQRLVYVKSADIKMTWGAYEQKKHALEMAANKARSLWRDEMESMEPDIRSMFGPDDVAFDFYESRFSVSIAAMKYLLQLHDAGAAA